MIRHKKSFKFEEDKREKDKTIGNKVLIKEFERADNKMEIVKMDSKDASFRIRRTKKNNLENSGILKVCSNKFKELYNI